MVEEYLTEEEQAEALKQWARDNWAWIAAGIVIGVVLLLGWQYYTRYKMQRAETAGQLLEQYSVAQSADKSKADALLQELTSKYPATPYADEAHLLAAQHAVDSSEFDRAATELRTVMDSARDLQLRGVARLRLARVLMQQQKYDDALQLLDIDKAGAFIAQTQEIRGDVLYAKGDSSGARSAYQAALDASKADPAANVALLQLKLDDLGGSTAVAGVKSTP